MTTASESASTAPYKGYQIEPTLLRGSTAEGNAGYMCVLTATEVAESPTPLVFERTLELSQTQAAVTNQRQPGSMPPQEQLDAELVDTGITYMQALIDLVNHGFRTIARRATLSTSEVRSRIGMTDAALQRREQ